MFSPLARWTRPAQAVSGETGVVSTVLRFSVVFTAMSLLFTLVSWGQVDQSAQTRRGTLLEWLPFWISSQGAGLEVVLHLVRHVAVGVVTALPTWRRDLIALTGLGVLAIDADHLSLLGLPTVNRASHSLGFMLIIGAVIWFLGRQGLLGRRNPPLVLALIAMSIVATHTALDILDTGFGVPILAPASFRIRSLTVQLAIAMQGVAILAVIAAAALLRKRARALTPGPAPEISSSEPPSPKLPG